MLTVRHVIDGRVDVVDADRVGGLLARGEGIVWVDITAPTPDEDAFLDHPAFALHDLVIEDMREDSHLPKLDVFPDHLLLTVHSIVVEASTIEVETAELDVALGPRFVITYHREPTDPVDHLAAQLERLAPTITRPAQLVHRLLDLMDDLYVPFLELIGQRLDMVEEDLIESPTARTRDEIFTLRRDLITLRRISVPQAEVIRRLSREDIGLLSSGDRALFSDIHDHLYRMSEVSEVYRQLVESAYDMYRSVRDDETNRRLTVLTMVSAVLLPISTIAGIYGMNFVHMPELDEALAYPVVWLIFVVVIIGELVLFRSWGWLGRREDEEEMARRSVVDRLDIPALGRVLRVPEYGARFAVAGGRRVFGLRRVLRRRRRAA